MKAHNLRYILDAVRAERERREVSSTVKSLADKSDAKLMRAEKDLEAQLNWRKSRTGCVS
jgi:hypothetical protein